MPLLSVFTHGSLLLVFITDSYFFTLNKKYLNKEGLGIAALIPAPL
jgi:hypothetical protein